MFSRMARKFSEKFIAIPEIFPMLQKDFVK